MQRWLHVFVMSIVVEWSLYGVLGRKFIKVGSPRQTTTYTMTVGALAFIIVSFMQQSVVAISEIPLLAWLSILFMSIGMSVLGYLWWNKGIAQIGAAKTSLFFNLVPVVTMFRDDFSHYRCSIFLRFSCYKIPKRKCEYITLNIL